jgi:hypothetical protein
MHRTETTAAPVGVVLVISMLLVAAVYTSLSRYPFGGSGNL